MIAILTTNGSATESSIYFYLFTYGPHDHAT